MDNITLVIPTYKNPGCLDICLRAATEGKVDINNDILVVVDGFMEQSKAILDKYSKLIKILDLGDNQGMQTAQNVGVMQSITKYIYIINDDDVMPTNWDVDTLHEVELAEKIYGDKFVLTVNQIEPPAGGHSMFNFPIEDLGRTPETFDYDKWLKIQKKYNKDEFTETGNIYPFVIQKKWYLACGGFDTYYDSPNICDWDFFLKLQMLGFKSPRTHYLHIYHFGSIATKKNSESATFRERENRAFAAYDWKWGTMPYNEPGNNNKIPKNKQFRGFVI